MRIDADDLDDAGCLVGDEYDAVDIPDEDAAILRLGLREASDALVAGGVLRKRIDSQSDAAGDTVGGHISVVAIDILQDGLDLLARIGRDVGHVNRLRDRMLSLNSSSESMRISPLRIFATEASSMSPSSCAV